MMSCAFFKQTSAEEVYDTEQHMIWFMWDTKYNLHFVTINVTWATKGAIP